MNFDELSAGRHLGYCPRSVWEELPLCTWLRVGHSAWLESPLVLVVWGEGLIPEARLPLESDIRSAVSSSMNETSPMLPSSVVL